MKDRLTPAGRNMTPYLLLLVVLVVGLGGGYALAATKTKTITVCADKKTGVLHLHTRGKCGRGQTKVTWNQQGPAGPQGATGPAGASAVSVWANVTDSGAVAFGQGISVQHVMPGTYEVTITAPGCAQGSNAPVVSLSDSSAPGGQQGSFPVAWYAATGANQQFMVFTGVVTNGIFSPSDHTFDVMDPCM
jgi:hypothetical protein